jgi:uncharacterized Zn-binding protein involved in type VI secretion
MPLAVLNGDFSLGHCWPPAPSITTSQQDVFCHSILVVVEGDTFSPHPGPCGDSSTHVPKTVPGIGSPTVFIGGKKIYRDGDLLSCGDVAKVQSHTDVFIDGLGAKP